MKTYQDILNRMVEIIKLSAQKKIEIEAKDEFDVDKNQKNQLFFGYPYSIYKDYQEEYDDLKNRELTYYLLSENKNAFNENQKLYNQCLSQLDDDYENKEDYEKLIAIIKNSFGKTANDLITIMGYFIVREDFELFKQLCKKLKVGIGVQLNPANVSESSKIREESQKEHSKQIKRIAKELERLIDKQKTIEEQSQSDLETQKSQPDDLATKSNHQDTKNDNFKEIIYLGMCGYLNPKMVAELKIVLKNDEFKELLDALKKHGIFNEQELLQIEIESAEKVKTINEIDELVAFLALRDDLNVEALMILIPSIGLNNYYYLIKKLYNFGKIEYEAYKEHLMKIKNIEIENKSREK